MECRDVLDLLSENTQVTLIWIPGYSDIGGDETADELARVASDIPLLGTEPGIAVSLPTLYSFINEWKSKAFKSDAPITRQTKKLCRSQSEVNPNNFSHSIGNIDRSLLAKLPF